MPSSRILISVFAVALTITLLACGGAVSNNPSAQATSSSSTSIPASAPTILNITDASSTNSNPNCAATWLASLQQIAEPSAGQTINGIQIVSWNDYESSQQIEAGIDNCVSITPALTGSTLSWQVTGNTATIDHYAVFTSTDGTTLTPIGSVPPTTANFNLTTANLSPANYTVFIQAVGKPSVLNKISPAVLYAAKQPPTVAVSVSPTSGIAPLAVNASITSSAVTGSVISSNSINFGDGTVVNAATATHTYSSSGTYTVTATATDNNNLSSTATATVTVAASLQPPTAKLTVTPTSGTAPLAVSASTAGSTDPNTGGSITSTTINFGDGTVVNTATASHTYSAAGTYTVTAKVTDNNNLSSTTTATVSVGSAPGNPPAGSDTVYLRDPTRANYCMVKGASGSPVTITCDASTPHGFSVGDVIVIYNVRGNVIANGIRKVATTPTTTTFTITDINGTAVNSSAAYIDPSTLNSYFTFPAAFGGASPVKLYTLTAHPRGWLDGPSGTLTTALSNASGRANPSGVQYTALTNSYNANSSTYSTWTGPAINQGAQGAPFASAALKWWVDGQPSGAKQTFATWAILNPTYWWGTMACDETVAYCGTPHSDGSVDYDSLFIPSRILEYELVYSTLTSGQRQSFADFTLNDNAESADGLGMHGSVSTGCTKPPTSGTVTWTTGMCGDVWTLKHHQDSILSTPEAYSPAGGAGEGYDLSNIGGWTKPYGYLLTGLSLCGSDGGDPVADRGCRLATEASAYMWDHVWANAMQSYGRGNSNDTYNRDRVETMISSYVKTLQNSVVGFPTINTNLTRNILYEFIYNELPYSSSLPAGNSSCYPAPWGEAPGYGTDFNSIGGFRTLSGALFAQHGTVAEQYGWHWINNRCNWWSASNMSGAQSSYLPWHYVFVDPTVTGVDPSGNLTNQFIFRPESDAATACTSLNLNCSLYNAPVLMAISRTGLAANTDTLLQVQNTGDTTTLGGDGHGSFGCPGCLRVFKNTALLAGNAANAPDGFFYDYSSGTYNHDNVIEVGGDPKNFRGAIGYCALAYNQSTIARWAGGSNSAGDSLSRFAYAMVDLTNAYCSSAGITHAWKHIVHFKKSGSQDYIVGYFDGAASSATQFREYLHYRQKQDQVATVYSPGITLVRANKTVSVADTSTSARLNSLILNVAGGNSIYFNTQNSSDTDLTYTGEDSTASGRVEVGSSTNGTSLGAVSTAEWAYVHQPSTSTSTTMPTITQPTCSGTGGNCTAVQIADSSSPKVAVFGRQGANLTGAAFTSTHSGTAQYVIAGLAPGTYNVTVGGSTVVSGATVSANDNSLYFESTAGSVTVTPVP